MAVNLRKDSFEQKIEFLKAELERIKREDVLRSNWALYVLCGGGRRYTKQVAA